MQELSRVPIQLQGSYDTMMDVTNDTHDDQMHSEISTMPSPIADNNSKDTDTDKPLQDLPDYDDLDEEEVTSLPTYETARRLRTVKLLELPTTPSPITDNLRDISNDRDTDKPLQELPNYDDLDEDEAASLPTYGSARGLPKLSEVPTTPSPITDNDRDTDKPLQELPNYDLDEDKAAPHTYESARGLHTVKMLEVPTMPSRISVDISKDRDTDELLQQLSNCADESKTLSLPTYKTTTKLHTVKMKGTFESNYMYTMSTSRE